MMPTFPSSPLRFRTAGFPQYGSKAGLSDGACPGGTSNRVTWFASVVRVVCSLKYSSLCVEVLGSAQHRRASGLTALPQGPSLRSGL